MNYTKGEWKAYPCTGSGDYKVTDGAEHRVARVFTFGAYRESANAHLIAAAPRLHKALERVREDINWMLNNQKFLNPEVFDYIDEALAKAEG